MLSSLLISEPKFLSESLHVSLIFLALAALPQNLLMAPRKARKLDSARYSPNHKSQLLSSTPAL